MELILHSGTGLWVSGILALQKDSGIDVAGEVAAAPAVGELTVEQHARKNVRVYYENKKSDVRYSSNLEDSKSASERVFTAYGS